MASDATPADADTDPPSALPRGTQLGEFELRRVIGAGGFGIVYLALDHTLEREVAVKEYMPASLVGRTETLHLSLRSTSDADTFELGRRSFVNEAKLLARFDHPSLLKVYRYWEANGTAYMAMPVLAGPTLRDIRASMSEPPTEAWMRTTLLMPLLGAIERLHGAGVFHRDIAPDNIVVEPDGHPVLLDFGAARHVIGDKTHALTAILKPAYAPLEQYAEAGSLKQGPWTDIYALGATLHFVLLGKPPMPATARALSDDHAPLARQTLPGVSAEFLRVLDWMLEPRPADRPQSVAALRAVLDGHAPVAPPPPAPSPPAAVADAAWQPTQQLVPATEVPAAAAPPRWKLPAPGWLAAGGAAAALLLALVLVLPRPAAPPSVAPGPAASAATAAAPAPAPAASVAAAPAASAPAPVVAAAAIDPAPPPTVATRAPPRSAPPRQPPPLRPVLEESRSTAGDVPQPAPAPRAPDPAPQQPSQPQPTAGPNERCGARVLLALWMCIDRECSRPELRNHAECVRWRAEQDRRANQTQ